MIYTLPGRYSNSLCIPTLMSWRLSISELVQIHKTCPQIGLNPSDIESLRTNYGTNILGEDEKVSPFPGVQFYLLLRVAFASSMLISLRTLLFFYCWDQQF
jgi:hypothetical protein